jgi:hypothetical protein
MPTQDYANYQLGISWGTPHPEGYGTSPQTQAELLAMLSGQSKGKYHLRGYAYLTFDPSASQGDDVVYSLVNQGSKEWADTHRRGEFEVVAMETEGKSNTSVGPGQTMRLDQGSNQSTRVGTQKDGQIEVGIWRLHWKRDDSGKLVSLIAQTEAKKFVKT